MQNRYIELITLNYDQQLLAKDDDEFKVTKGSDQANT